MQGEGSRPTRVLTNARRSAGAHRLPTSTAVAQAAALESAFLPRGTPDALPPPPALPRRRPRALAACNREQAAPPRPPPNLRTPPRRPLPRTPSAADINAADFAELVKTLASDEFEGRGPGTPGEDKTVDYIKAQFERIGLKPGNGDSYFQAVPMTETTADEATALKLDVNGKPRELKFGTDMVVGTRSGKPEVKIEDSELVFVGYGVDAPEQKWNDYAGVDVKGKTVVMFVNDPGFHAKDATLFEGKRMTYYGRWTYKFEEAARKGAAAALIIHDTEGAVLRLGRGRRTPGPARSTTCARPDDPAPRLPAQGWITGDAAKALFADAGLDLDKLRAAANKRGFKPVPMTGEGVARPEEHDRREVLAQRGRPAAGHRASPTKPCVYMAHWDHLGKHDGESRATTIYNGAVDNATGVAGIIEIAEAFATSSRKPERSVLFLAVTLEESGLLGSKYYVAHPSIPLDKIVGGDQPRRDGRQRARPRDIDGDRHRQLGTGGHPQADRRQAGPHACMPNRVPRAGGYFRSDHFNFAKAGVPALYADGGDDLVEGGKAAGEAAAKDYNDNRYHKPGDEYDAATWKLDGTSTTSMRCTASAASSPTATSGRTGTRATRSAPRATRC